MSAPSVAPVVIEVEDATITHGARTIVAGVSFEVRLGSTLALLGRNGAGKSSLVRALLGQRRLARGRITVFGRDVWTDHAALMERIGVVPEQPDLPPDMTADELMAFSRALYPRWNDDETRARCERLGIPLRVPAGRLSKGQTAQLALTLALGHGPELLVLDDPTLGLDTLARRDFLAEVVGELADRGSTILLTTHDLSAVERIADHLVVLDRGTVVMDDDVEGVKATFRQLRDRSASLEDIFAALTAGAP